MDEGNEITRRGADDVYELQVTLLHATNADPEQAESAATLAKKRVEEIFLQRCFQKTDTLSKWQWLELVGVDVISDQALTYANSLQLMKWQADHVSLRTDPPQPMFEESRKKAAP